MNTLLHVCCAPCSVACIEQLREEGIEPTAFWHNPNIHPFTEYRARRDTVRTYMPQVNVSLIEEGDYGLRPFLDAIPSWEDRCGTCYALRLEAAAAYTASHGFSSFSTTLLISPYQNHELLRAVAEKAGENHGVAFLYRDFRPRFREGQQKAREAGLYMQKYCGCIFSEEERYRKKKR
ncbi:MAG: epoxyqueuosine reductase QueH [Candidatus Pelethousia sp.]|nr:epoxyqueuosine reductase QueH [Candidatus Pelethousia sp.]